MSYLPGTYICMADLRFMNCEVCRCILRFLHSTAIHALHAYPMKPIVHACRTLDTMSGEPLRFHWDKSGLERISISMNDRLLAILETPGNSSCKEGSVVHRISRVMLDSDVNAVMAEQETIVETQEPQNSNSKNNGQDARKLLTIGLPCLIAAVTAICVAVFVWIKLSDSNMGSEESEASGAHGAADPDPSNSKHSKHSKNAPKVCTVFLHVPKTFTWLLLCYNFEHI